eukprot:6192330-Pleurochrysis_carterae.AAC.3
MVLLHFVACFQLQNHHCPQCVVRKCQYANISVAKTADWLQLAQGQVPDIGELADAYFASPPTLLPMWERFSEQRSMAC